MAQFRDLGLHLTWKNHPGALVQKFNFLLEGGKFVDVTLTAGGQSLKAHRLILAASSEYFEDYFARAHQSDCYDTSPPEINLEQIQFEDLQVLIDYMYRGEITVPWHQLHSLLEAASNLRIRALASQVRELMPIYGGSNADSTNSLKQLQLSDAYESVDTRSEVSAFGAAQFNLPETGLMDEEAGGYTFTFPESSDQPQFTGLPETVSGDPLLSIQDNDSKSNASDGECIDPGWDDGVLPLTRAQFEKARAEYLAQKSQLVALKPNEVQEDAALNEETVEERDVPEHIERSEIDHLSSRDDDANSSAADFDGDEREKEEEAAKYDEGSAEESQRSSPDIDADNLSDGEDYIPNDLTDADENSTLDDSTSLSEPSDEEFSTHSSTAGPSKRKRKSSAKPSSKPSRPLKKGKVDASPQRTLPERPFPCTICDRRYKRGDHLQRHLKEFHSVAKESKRQAQLHQPSSFRCTICGLKLKYKRGLKRHIRTVHQTDPSNIVK